MFSALYMERGEKICQNFTGLLKEICQRDCSYSVLLSVRKTWNITFFQWRKVGLRYKNTVYLWKVYNFVQSQASVMQVSCPSGSRLGGAGKCSAGMDSCPLLALLLVWRDWRDSADVWALYQLGSKPLSWLRSASSESSFWVSVMLL